MSSTEELLSWASEQKSQKAVEALDKNGFNAVYCKTKQQAFDYIIKESAEVTTIGLGGSMSIAGLNVADKLKDMGKELLNPRIPELTPEERLAITRRHLTCDLFLTGTNALTLTGYLVNIDNFGNRVASMGFGPKKVIIVAGRNKLVNNIEEGIKRIKTNVAPIIAKQYNLNTPCAKTGFCSDCNSPDRICRITTIIEHKPKPIDIHVLVVNEDMGL